MIDVFDLTGLDPEVTVREHMLLDKLDRAEASLIDLMQFIQAQADLPDNLAAQVREDLEAIRVSLHESGFNYAHYPTLLADLPVHSMTDQPPTCPKCGDRIKVWLQGETGNKQVVKCRPCNFIYRLEEDEDDQAQEG